MNSGKCSGMVWHVERMDETTETKSSQLSWSTKGKEYEKTLQTYSVGVSGVFCNIVGEEAVQPPIQLQYISPTLSRIVNIVVALQSDQIKCMIECQCFSFRVQVSPHSYAPVHLQMIDISFFLFLHEVKFRPACWYGTVLSSHESDPTELRVPLKFSLCQIFLFIPFSFQSYFSFKQILFFFLSSAIS